MCIFCQIVGGEIPSYKVYEDDKILAFLDIQPVAPGHTLVIPKKHYADLGEISEEDLKNLILSVKKLSTEIKAKLGAGGYNVTNNNGLAGGQTVPHIHFHIIPRLANDGLESWPHRVYEAGEAEEIVKKLTS